MSRSSASRTTHPGESCVNTDPWWTSRHGSKGQSSRLRHDFLLTVHSCRALILSIQTLALYKSFTYLFIYVSRRILEFLVLFWVLQHIQRIYDFLGESALWKLIFYLLTYLLTYLLYLLLQIAVVSSSTCSCWRASKLSFVTSCSCLSSKSCRIFFSAVSLHSTIFRAFHICRFCQRTFAANRNSPGSKEFKIQYYSTSSNTVWPWRLARNYTPSQVVSRSRRSVQPFGHTSVTILATPLWPTHRRVFRNVKMARRGTFQMYISKVFNYLACFCHIY